MPGDVWSASINAPSTTHALERQTELYVDLYIALRVLSMPYSQYMRLTSQRERHLYRLFLILEQAKDEHHREKAAQFADAEREAKLGGGSAPHARA